MTERGFTLIEILVALTIVSIGLVGLVKAQSQQTKNLIYLEQKTIADLVAANLATEVRLNSKVFVGDRSGTKAMAQRTWKWRTSITPTPNTQIVQAMIYVYPPHEHDPTGTNEPLSELTVYVLK